MNKDTTRLVEPLPAAQSDIIYFDTESNKKLDIEKAISKHKDNVVCVAVGEDAMLNNLQRCSKNKKVYLAEDVNAALSAC